MNFKNCCLVFITLSVLLEITQSGDSITLLRKILITTPLGGRESHAINQQRHHVRRAISEARNEFHITAQKMLSLRRALYYSNKSLREYCNTTTAVSHLSIGWLSSCEVTATNIASAYPSFRFVYQDIDQITYDIATYAKLVNTALPTDMQYMTIRADLGQILRHLHIKPSMIQSSSLQLNDMDSFHTNLLLLGQINNLLIRSLM